MSAAMNFLLLFSSFLVHPFFSTSVVTCLSLPFFFRLSIILFIFLLLINLHSYLQVLLPEYKPKSLAADELAQEPSIEDLVRTNAIQYYNKI
jgi:hypothetical protein